MDTTNKMKEWLIKMGYTAEIPSNLHLLCNPTTALLWEQLITRVKPRQEIKSIRQNILINRLLNKEKNSILETFEEENEYPIQEIEIWEKKEKLKCKINHLREDVNEAKKELNDLRVLNKVTYENMMQIKQNIKTNNQSRFLLISKSAELQDDITKMQENLELMRNLTPVESEHYNKHEVLETLQQCSKKLEGIVKYELDNSGTSNISSRTFTPYKRIINNHTAKSNIKRIKNDQIFCSTKISQNAADTISDMSNIFENTFASSNSDKSVPEILENVINDKLFNESIQKLLYKYNRSIICNILEELYENHTVSLISDITEKEIASQLSNDEKSELANLYSTHVEYALKDIRTKLNIKVLKKELDLLLNHFLETLSNNPEYSSIKRGIELKIREAGLKEATEKAKMIILEKSESHKNNNSSNINTLQLSTLQSNINSKLASIESGLTIFQQLHDMIFQTHRNMSSHVYKLSQFTTDKRWMSHLEDNISEHEIQSLVVFPFEFNRTVVINNTKIFKRELPLNETSCQILNGKLLYDIVTLLNYPWKPAELILLNLVHDLNKLKSFTNLLKEDTDLPLPLYSLKVEKQHNSMDVIVSKLKCEGHIDSCNNLIEGILKIKETTQLWTEMPFEKYILKDRLYKGQNFEYYKTLFENYYKKLQ